MEIGRRRKSHRRLSLYTRGDQGHEEPAASRWADSQQRFHIRPRSAAELCSIHRDEARITGLTKSTSLDCRKYDIACGQIDIGNAATEMTQGMVNGVPQANGEIAVEPRIQPEHVARAVVYMASLPLDANVQFMTVMATKMPFIGRG